MRITTNGIELKVSVSGDGPPVMLLHGFPDTHRVWRHQIPALVDAGFQVIAPDLRGCGDTTRPASVDDYHLLHSASDIAGILDHLGHQSAHIVGHDFGAALGWMMGTLAPERVDHLVVLSVGHPAAFRNAGLLQRAMSWYMLLFQFEGIAERWISDGDFANLRNWGGHPDVDEVIERFRDPAALTAALNWYRSNTPASSLVEPAPVLPPVTAPTTGVWSSGDIALTERQMTDSAEYVTGPWAYHRLDGVGHWMQCEQPDVVNQIVIDALG